MIPPDWSSLQKFRGAKLPHWSCNDAIYHVCFRLADSIPEAMREKWIEEKRLLCNSDGSPKRNIDPETWKQLKFLFSKKVDACLDAGYGKCLLKNPQATEIMRRILKYFEENRYRLHAWAIMPNHVHVIVNPFKGYQLREITHSWKSYSANQINRAMGRVGILWARESYDHIIRSEAEYLEQVEYVWNNPVKAGLPCCPRWRIDR